ncbi:hypothetical protein [Lentzea sp. E54]|uniref:hypothetical protein n=1 Tax=Lentzea xerophila TaxID=3435883 RepID=UPI003DA4788F
MTAETNTGTTAWTTADLRAVVDRVSRVPDRYRVFDRDTHTAHRVFGLGAEVLSVLLDLGFPCRGQNGERSFDELDLTNASLALRLPSPRYLAMRGWPQTFRSSSESRPIRYDVTISAGCGFTEPGHGCDFRPAAGLGQEVSAGRFTLRREVGGSGDAVEVPAALERLFSEVSRLHFHVLPVALYRDLGFLEETSLANCDLASLHVARRAEQEGWEARRCFGLLLSSPYSAEHFWPEVRLDGVWTAFDPHTINSLVRWQVLAPGEVPLAQPLNDAFHRVAGDWVDLVQDAGRPARLSLLTRRQPLDDAEGTLS